jgi:hypothetical protein
LWRSFSPPRINRRIRVSKIWEAWQRLKEKFFGYHRDISAEEIAQGLGGRIVFQRKAAGRWVAVIAFDQKAE